MSTYKTYIEIPVTIHYDHQPEEKTVMYPNDKAHPGCSESVTINSVELNDFDISDHLGIDDCDHLEESILESLKGEDE